MNKILLAAALFSTQAFAGAPQFGRIVDLKGEGFISFQGKTREMKKGDAIEVGAEIVIEHKGQVSFTDNADHRFHLGNASSAMVTATNVELRNGDLWFQSLNRNDTYKVTTANAIVDYSGGEGILSYDTVRGKTQLMVINNIMKLSNLRAPDLNLSVTEGQFSFVDNAYEGGVPRDPTPVGEKTYTQLVSLFSDVSPMDKNSANLFKDQKTAHAEHAKVKTGRAVASVESNDDHVDKVMEEYKKSILEKPMTNKVVTNKPVTPKIKTAEKKKVGTSKLIVHIYGQTSTPTTAYSAETAPTETKTRAPASVIELDVPKDDVIENKKVDSVTPYSKDYKNQYKESDKLIDDLKKL